MHVGYLGCHGVRTCFAGDRANVHPVPYERSCEIGTGDAGFVGAETATRAALDGTHPSWVASA